MNWREWLCAHGIHQWRWLPENRERCVHCGHVRQDLP